ncbi:MAG: glycosyltransferase family 4 protein [Phycisphaeraceae bacterium]|nr:glycosyltransferase family 4 protein [Phycisphaeraceae bacterium]
MRILTIIHGLGPGGMERVAQNCALAYAKGGHDSAVFSHSHDGHRRAILERAGVPVFVGGESEAERVRGAREAWAWGPDVVHIHRFGYPEPAAGHVLRVLRESAEARGGREGQGGRLPVVETNHFARADATADRLLIDAHIQISRWCMWQWRRWSRGLRPEAVGVLVPHMVKADVFRRAAEDRIRAFRAEFGVPEDAVLFGRVGQTTPSIWPPTLIDVFEEVARGDGRAWLMVVGSPDSLIPRIERLPEDVRRRVVRVPFIVGDERLVECYSAMDVFLHVTLIGDSFGLVLCEAMLCGTPVITLSTPCRGNSQVEVVGHRRGGLVCADIGSIPGAMRTLMDDAGLRRRYGLQGGEFVRREFDPERITGMLLRVLAAVRRHESREELRIALAEDPAMVRGVGWKEIRGLRDDALGRTPLSQRLLMHIVGQPWIYRLIRLVRRPPKEGYSDPGLAPRGAGAGAH